VKATDNLSFIIILLFSGLFASALRAQDCTSAGDNVLCADNPVLEDSLYNNPVEFECFDVQMAQFYSVITGSTTGGALNLTIMPGDCDSFIGPDEISVIIVNVPTGGDPCDQASYSAAAPCFSSTTEAEYIVQNLAPDSEFLIIVGSNHDTTYGPCNYTIDISGSSVDVVASVDPIFVTLGEEVNLSALGATTGEGYTWAPAPAVDNSTSANTSSFPEETTTYTATTTIGECASSDQVTVTVGPPINIFNTFTPNGDGINDTWTILGIERFEDARLNVYDRWGQNVFTSLGYGSRWEGTNRGKFLPAGAYYYVIELNSPNIEIPPLSGVISIIR